MITSGCDVGSRTAKAVILKENVILASAVIPATVDPVVSARSAMDAALEMAGLEMSDLCRIVGTGYGQKEIPFAHDLASEIVCHARGAWWNTPSVRMIIDIGGQDAKAIKLDAAGNVIRYIYNDKCASGTGRFLEIMAQAMQIDLNDMGDIGRSGSDSLTISSQCVIFAETEVVSLINDEKEVPDIINALHRALGNRVASQARSLQAEEDVVMTGGVAKNSGVRQAISHVLGVPVNIPEGIDPQINGALGAALIAAAP